MAAPAVALDDLVAAAIAAAIAEHPTHFAAGEKPRVAVAYSGGGDSTALLHATSRCVARGVLDAVALHVHHGLAADADAWLVHCREEAERLDVPFDSERIAIDRTVASVEGEARRLRYAALARLCALHRCTVLLTAHHADDQAETVLLNLLRGAGIGGLAATARSRWMDGVLLSRPFLDVPAATLHADLAAQGLSPIEDPSNEDRRYTRNAIRLEVMPALRRIAPTVAARLAQTAMHAASMQELLDEIGHEDLRPGVDDEDEAGPVELDVDRLRTLSPARAANALRVWLAHRAMRAPSTAALKEMLDQLLHAAPDAQIELLHERQTLRLYRGRVAIDGGAAPRASFEPLVWRGEDLIDVPGWRGRLRFVTGTAHGFDAAALRNGPLSLRERRGGERMRLRADGRSRTLKNLYQEAGIAAWQRPRLPLVFLADRMLYAAGLGPNAVMTLDASAGIQAVMLDWEPYPDGLVRR